MKVIYMMFMLNLNIRRSPALSITTTYLSFDKISCRKHKLYVLTVIIVCSGFLVPEYTDVSHGARSVPLGD